MKREILFKAKRVDNDEWVKGKSLIQGVIEGREFVQIEHSDFDNYRQYEVHHETVCQFTGKLDVSKNMIFENDIVYHGENPLNKVVVIWNKRTCGFVLNRPNYQNEFTRISGLGKLKIIGNIHD